VVALSPAEDSGALLELLAATGAIGSTVRQLADSLQSPPERVGKSLEELRRAGSVLRIGRGLWILRSFERLNERADFVDPAEYVERFVREGGVPLGTYRGPITFASNETLPVHRWWPYVQGYSAEFVAGLLASSELRRGATVLDPFCGSGTTLVEARRMGALALGAELLPPAALAASVKTSFEISPVELRKGAARAISRSRHGRPGELPFLRETRRQFAPRVLRELLELRESLPESGRPVHDAIRLAFSRILVPVSRLRRSPCLGYAPASDAPERRPVVELRKAIEEMAEDLVALGRERSHWGPAARILPTDARSLALPAESVDLAVTSPPYVNGMDYVMNYKIDLAWLGYARSYSDLSRLRKSLVSCDNLPRGEASLYTENRSDDDPWLREILDRIRTNVARKGSYRRQDVHGIVRRYFEDLTPVLRRVHASLRPGGRFVLVVGDSLLAGTYVPGDLLLARMGARVGFDIESVVVARPRRSGQRRSFLLRESIVTLRRPGSAAAAG
jgi:hypothetical protein